MTVFDGPGQILRAEALAKFGVWQPVTNEDLAQRVVEKVKQRHGNQE